MISKVLLFNNLEINKDKSFTFELSILNVSFLVDEPGEKIMDFIGTRKNVDVTISLKEIPVGDEVFLDSLNHSIKQADDIRNLISFTMEEFMAYSPAKGA